MDPGLDASGASLLGEEPGRNAVQLVAVGIGAGGEGGRYCKVVIVLKTDGQGYARSLGLGQIADDSVGEGFRRGEGRRKQGGQRQRSGVPMKAAQPLKRGVLQL